MDDRLSFEPYRREDRQACLALFDANCPAYFAPNERVDYEAYLDGPPIGYEICRRAGVAVGGFGMARQGGHRHGRLNWILIDPRSQGTGIGTRLMERALERARELGLSVVHISASQHSAPFFSRFAARIVEEIPHGWGPGMHRIEMTLEPPEM